MKNLKKLSTLISLVLTFSCVDNSKQVITLSASPSASISAKPTLQPSPNVSITPITSTTATPQATASASILPSPTNTPIKNSSGISIIPVEKRLKLDLGINNVYRKITDGKSSDYQRDITDIKAYFGEIKPSFVIVNAEQKLVNPSFGEKDFSWAYYDKIFDSVKDSDSEVFVKIKFDQIYNDKSSPSLSSYQLFLNNFVERYQDRKMAFIVGEKLNDESTFSGIGSKVDFVKFFEITYNIIKNRDKTKNIYLGSLEQSELFGTNKYKMIDDLLSFINLGADKYTDGFIFDIYSLATDVSNQDRLTILADTNYTIIKDYHDKIIQLLKKKGLENKKLFLSTGTFGGEIFQSIKQDQVQQANELIRQLIYSKYAGYDYVYLPRLIDRLPDESSESIFNSFGLVNYNNLVFDKKLSYWAIKFLADKLKGATLIGVLNGLPEKCEGFVFEKEDKTKSYIVWSNDPKNDVNINIPVDGKNAKIYISPLDGDKNSTALPTVANENGDIVLSFYSNNTNPRIIELVK